MKKLRTLFLGWKHTERRKKVTLLILTALVISTVLTVYGFTKPNSKDDDDDSSIISEVIIEFNDSNLETALKDILEIENRSITTTDMEGLTYLSLAGKGIHDISGLQNAQNLKVLNLDYNNISEVDYTFQFNNLQSLSMKGNQLKNLGFISENLRALKQLDASKNSIESISAVSAVEQLVTLDLSNNYIIDISPLESLTNLGELLLSHNYINGLEPLRNLHNLRVLEIADNYYFRYDDRYPSLDLHPLENMKNLVHIDLSNSLVLNTSLDVLSTLSSIEILSLSNIGIETIETHGVVHEDGTETTELSSFQRGLEDIEFISGLNKLKHLKLGGNEISNFSPIAELTNLVTLDISDNTTHYRRTPVGYRVMKSRTYVTENYAEDGSWSSPSSHWYEPASLEYRNANYIGATIIDVSIFDSLESLEEVRLHDIIYTNNITSEGEDTYRLRKISALNEHKDYHIDILNGEYYYELLPEDIRKGWDLFGEEKYEEAIGAFNSYIESGDEYFDAYTGKGWSLYGGEQYEEAIDSFDKAIESKYCSSYAYTGKGSILYEMGNFKEATDVIDKAIELNPEDITAYTVKGDILAEQKNYDEALLLYGKAIGLASRLNLNSASTSAYARRGAILYEKGDHDGALEAFIKSVELDSENSDLIDLVIELYPENTYFYSQKGYNLYHQGSYQESIEAFDKVTELDPENTDAYTFKGRNLYDKGMYDEAIAAFNKALKIEADNTYVHSWKGFTLYIDKDYQESLESFDKVLELEPDNTYALTYKGYCLYEQEKYQEALEAFNKALELNPDDQGALQGKEAVLQTL